MGQYLASMTAPMMASTKDNRLVPMMGSKMAPMMVPTMAPEMEKLKDSKKDNH